MKSSNNAVFRLNHVIYDWVKICYLVIDQQGVLEFHVNLDQITELFAYLLKFLIYLNV